MPVTDTRLPLVSVCMASFNHGPYVAAAVQSVLDQTFSDFEFLIVDDGSTDDTLSVLQGFDDPRIRLEGFAANRSACLAANYLIQMARGKYVSVISSDDVWEPFKLKRQVAYLESNPGTLATFTSATIINEKSLEVDPGDASLDPVAKFYLNIFNVENRSRCEWIEQFFFTGNCLCHSSVLIRQEFFLQHGFFNPALCQLPDLDLWIRLVQHGDINVDQEPLVRFRVLPGNRNASGLGDKQSRIFAETVSVYSQFFQMKDSGCVQRLIDRLSADAPADQAIPPGDYSVGLRLAMLTAAHHRDQAARISAINFIRSVMPLEIQPAMVLYLHSIELGNDSYNLVALADANGTIERLHADVCAAHDETRQAVAAAESRSAKADHATVLAEQQRALAEQQRVLAEQQRVLADQYKVWMEQYRTEALHYERVVNEILNSRIWRSTASIRRLVDRLKGVRHRLSPGQAKHVGVVPADPREGEHL